MMRFTVLHNSGCEKVEYSYTRRSMDFSNDTFIYYVYETEI